MPKRKSNNNHIGLDFIEKIDTIFKSNEISDSNIKTMVVGGLLYEVRNWIRNNKTHTPAELRGCISAYMADKHIQNKTQAATEWLANIDKKAVEIATPEIEKELESKIYKKLIDSSMRKIEKQTKIWTRSNISFNVLMAIFIAFVAGIILKYNVLGHFVEFLEGILKSLNSFNF